MELKCNLLDKAKLDHLSQITRQHGPSHQPKLGFKLHAVHAEQAGKPLSTLEGQICARHQAANRTGEVMWWLPAVCFDFKRHAVHAEGPSMLLGTLRYRLVHATGWQSGLVGSCGVFQLYAFT